MWALGVAQVSWLLPVLASVGVYLPLSLAHIALCVSLVVGWSFTWDQGLASCTVWMGGAPVFTGGPLAYWKLAIAS